MQEDQFPEDDQTNSIFSNSDDYAALCLLTAWHTITLSLVDGF